MKKEKTFRLCCGILAFALLASIWFFSSQTGEESGRLSDEITRFLMQLLGMEESRERFAKMSHIVRKAAHFNLFALLGLSLSFAFAPSRKPWRAFWAFPVAVLSAAADELHQTYVFARAGMWQDSLLDSCGALAGMTAAFLILLLTGRRRRNKRRMK